MSHSRVSCRHHDSSPLTTPGETFREQGHEQNYNIIIKCRKLNTEIILYAESSNVSDVFFIVFLVQEAIQENVWHLIAMLF